MLKKELITLVASLRTENSALRTQLEAAKAQSTPPAKRAGNPTPAAMKAACARLAKQYPQRRSFTGEEVRQACLG